MKIEYDKESNIASIYLSEDRLPCGVMGVSNYEDMILEFDEEEKLTLITILNADKNLPLELLL